MKKPDLVPHGLGSQILAGAQGKVAGLGAYSRASNNAGTNTSNSMENERTAVANTLKEAYEGIGLDVQVQVRGADQEELVVRWPEWTGRAAKAMASDAGFVGKLSGAGFRRLTVENGKTKWSWKLVE